MLTALGLATLVAWIAAVAFALTRLVDGLEARRFRRIAAEIRVTDAIHATLGAVVAPTVSGRGKRPWSVTIGLEPTQVSMAGRLTEVVRLALGQGEEGVRIVFVPRGSA